MHKSLIIPDNNRINLNNEIFEIHGRTFFNVWKTEPGGPTLCEILIRENSPYIKLIRERLFIPIARFDPETHSWYYNEKKIDLKTIDGIGWRAL